MHSFTYYSPTEIIFGKDSLEKLGDQIQKFQPSKVLVVYGSDRILNNGLYEKISSQILERGMEAVRFGGVKPNPTLEHAYEGVELAKEAKVDFILAVGGGSVIDTAKAIAHGCANPDVDIWDFWLGKKKVEKTMPIGVVLTIPAAGSESSNSAVLTDTSKPVKIGLSTDFNRPKFAIMDPTLTYSLPKYQIGCGVTDIMMHTLDRYFNPLDNELTDAIAEALLRTVIHYGSIAIENSSDYEAMSEIMWAGSISHNGLTGLGGVNDFAPHQLGHEISAKFDFAHGASLAAIWGSWAGYVYKERPERFARYGRNVWGICEEDDQKAALAAIEKTVAYFKSLGMPTCLSEGKGIGCQSEEVIRDMANRCSRNGARTIGSFKVLKTEDMYEIYKAANH